MLDQFEDNTKPRLLLQYVLISIYLTVFALSLYTLDSVLFVNVFHTPLSFDKYLKHMFFLFIMIQIEARMSTEIVYSSTSRVLPRYSQRPKFDFFYPEDIIKKKKSSNIVNNNKTHITSFYSLVQNSLQSEIIVYSFLSRVLTPYSQNQSSNSVLTRANLASNLSIWPYVKVICTDIILKRLVMSFKEDQYFQLASYLVEMKLIHINLFHIQLYFQLCYLSAIDP